MNRNWKHLASSYGEDLKLFKPRFDFVINPRNQLKQKMVVLEANDAANVVALTTEQRILFVKQYRFGIRKDTIELPGGMVDSDEPQEKAVQRELLEETGHGGGQWTYLGMVGSNPSSFSNYIYHWYAEGVQQMGPLVQDDGEDIELVSFSIPETIDRLKAGSFIHPHTISALVLFLSKYNYLV